MKADRSTAPVSIHALGGFRLVVKGRELRLRTRKEAMLLLELALAAPRRVRRDECIARLWPDSSEVRARHSLSEALRGIEQGTSIQVDRSPESLALPDGTVWTDARELAEAIAVGDVDAASRLYVGGFLAGWYPPTAESSHWVDRTSASIASSLEAMARAQVESRRRSTDSRGVTTAVGLLERLGVATERDREAAAEAAHITGWESLRPGEPVQARLPVDREGPFVGRTEEMRVLTAELERALAGELRVVLVAGEAGIGKTRTCQRLARLAALRGARLFLSSCYELEQSVAFGAISEAFAGAVTASDVATLKPAWQQVLGEVLPELAELVDVGSRSWEGETQHIALSAFAGLIEQLARERTALLLVDDLQWADATSCQVIHYLLRGSAPRRGALVVLAYRPEDLAGNSAAQVLLRTLTADHSTNVELAPMPAADIQRQLEGVLTNDEKVDLKEIVSLAEGSPFFARELALAGTRRDRTRRSLDEVVLSRVRNLPHDEASLLSLLAVAGAPLPVLTLAAISQQPVSSVIRALSLLRGRRLVKEVGAAVAVSHDITRAAIYNDLGDPARQSIHAALADAHATDAADSYLAFHYSKAGRRMMARSHALRAAASSRNQKAYEEELEWLLLGLANAEESERREDLDRITSRMFALARYADAVHILKTHARRLDPRLKSQLALADLKCSAATREAFNDLLNRCDTLFDQAVKLSLGTVAIEALREKMRFAQDMGEKSVVLKTAQDLESFGRTWPDAAEGAYARVTALLKLTSFEPEAVRPRLSELTADQTTDLPPKVRLALAITEAIDDYNRGHIKSAGLSCSNLVRRSRSAGYLEDEVRVRALLVPIRTESLRFGSAERHASFVFQYAGLADALWEKTITLGNLAATRLEQSDFAGVARLATAVLDAERKRPMWLLKVYGLGLLGACALEAGRMNEASNYAAQFESLPAVEDWVSDLSVPAVFLARYWARKGSLDTACGILIQMADQSRHKHRVCYWTVSLELAKLLPLDPEERRIRYAAIRAEARTNECRLVVRKADDLLNG